MKKSLPVRVSWKLLAAIVLTVLLTNPNTSMAIPLLQGQVTNLFSAHETASESLKFIAEEEGFSPGTVFTTSGQFDATSWNMSTTGMALGESLSLTFSGNLLGDFGNDITVTFSGSGNYGSNPFSSSGQVVLLFDAAQNDYFIAQYDDEMTYGSGTVSKTVRGAELIGGAIIGGYFGGWWGAFGGASGAWFLSDVVDTFVTGPTPPPPPVRPLPPANPPATIPPTPPTIENKGEFAGATFSGDNVTINKNRGNFIIGDGNLSSMTGQFQGSATVVPEPSTILLLGTGLIGVIGYGWSQRKRAA